MLWQPRLPRNSCGARKTFGQIFALVFSTATPFLPSFHLPPAALGTKLPIPPYPHVLSANNLVIIPHIFQYFKHIILKNTNLNLIWAYILKEVNLLKKISLVKSILIPLLIGAVSGFISMGAMKDFASLNKPSLSPPGWLFPVVWSILYVLMGISSYLVNKSDAPKEEIKRANFVYAISLFFNFFWSIIFFNLKQYFLAFIWLLVLLFLVCYTIYLYFGISKTAAYLQIPYVLWLLFAAYLNYGIYTLN